MNSALPCALPQPDAPSTSARLFAMQNALAQRRFFKLIGGGSFTEADKISHLVQAYTLAGVDCIDLAPDLAVLEATVQALRNLPEPHPVIMVSLPLDPDPHFRKIELEEPACITCGLCLPLCPTEAITLPDVLAISQSLCYGCGRCVPVCPTNALSLLPFQVESQIEAALSHPLVEAVEIHSHYVDPVMLSDFLQRWQPLLHHKLLSLCFRPQGIEPQRILDFYQTAVPFSSLPVMFQIDGAPMSGNDDPEASRPALEAAVKMAELFQQNVAQPPAITISGGINRHTAQWLQQKRYANLAGVGMGTVARKAIWTETGADASQTARTLVAPFKFRHPQKHEYAECVIM